MDDDDLKVYLVACAPLVIVIVVIVLCGTAIEIWG